MILPHTEPHPRIRATFYTCLAIHTAAPHYSHAHILRHTPKPHAKATRPPHTREQGERACLGGRVEAFSILKGAILVVNCAALRENLDRVQNAKMQIARADLSLGRGGVADSRACKARGQGRCKAKDRIVFYGLGVGFASVDSRGVALARGLAWLAWVRGVGEL